jgi:hypothetical protein
MTGKDDGGEEPPRPGRAMGAGSRRADWIGDHLKQVYDEALHEAIPAEMLALLGKLDDPLDNNTGEDEKSR